MKALVVVLAGIAGLVLASCGVYRFNDISVNPAIKTFKVTYIENKARYVNPQLSPRITDKLRQKIIAQTKMVATTGDADLEISGSVTDYSVTTSGISGTAGNRESSTNRLNVGLSIDLKNNIEPSKSQQTNIARNFDFAASLTLPQAETSLTDDIVKNIVDEIFNKIFSNW